MRARLFRFTNEGDIDAKEFAKKTGMAVLSVNSMIRHAKGNAKLYEEMVELGYSDDSRARLVVQPWKGRDRGEDCRTTSNNREGRRTN